MPSLATERQAFKRTFTLRLLATTAGMHAVSLEDMEGIRYGEYRPSTG